MRNFILTIVCIILITSCVSKTNLNTPSGRVEQTFIGVNVQTIIGAITDQMIDRNYYIKESSNTLLVFEKPADSFMAKFLFGSKYDRTPNLITSYAINNYNGKIRVVVSFSIVTNPGSAFEKVQHMDNNKSAPKYQKMLDELKETLENDKKA